MRDGVSEAGWSERDALEPDGEPGLAPAPERYEEVGVAGRGGMGEVMLVNDLRLKRRVALKRVAQPSTASPGERSRIVREAWVTARLEHPAIVPIYDVDLDASGTSFYTMRWIDGRTLADAIRDAQGPGDRLALIRHVLAAIHAIAFAHAHGIVHRDLKPGNIMVGPFGETFVVDWGLALTLESADAAGAPPEPVDTARAGTPGYMSPEQRDGGRVDRRSDVWALGAILRDVIGEPNDAAVLAPAPNELHAIISKATAQAPAARYPDAGALARDVERFLDGRRVDAYEYTTLELVSRLVRKLRVPLLLAGVIAAVAAAALAISVTSIARERTRAVRALEDARTASAWALAQQAITELDGGSLPEAELLAAHSLTDGESPDARGVLAAARAAAAPLSAETFELADCARVIPGSWTEAYCVGPSELAAWQLQPLEPRWHRALASTWIARSPSGVVVVLEGAARLHVLDDRTGKDVFSVELVVSTGIANLHAVARSGEWIAASEGRILNVVSTAQHGLVANVRICGSSPLTAIADGGEAIAVVCADGDVWSVDPHTGTPMHVVHAEQIAAIAPVALGASRDGRWLVVGGVRGQVLRLERSTGKISPSAQLLEGPVVRIEPTEVAHRIVIAGDRGPARVWDLEAGVELARLPRTVGADPAIVPEGLITGGRRAARWQLAQVLRPRAITVDAGISEVALDPTGRYLAIARGDGWIEIRARETAALVHAERIGEGVIKTLDFSLDGTELAVSIAESGRAPIVIATADWQHHDLASEPPRPARRLAFDAAGNLLALHWAPPLSVWSAAGAPRTIATPELVDVARDPTRSELTLLGKDGSVWSWRDAALTRVGTFPAATMIAMAPRHGVLAAGQPGGVTLQSRTGETRWLASPDARLLDLVISPDERYLAGGRGDGSILVWRDGQLVARLRGHHQAVTSLAFGPDSLLYSASWDGAVMMWDLGALDKSPAELLALAQRRWAIDRSTVISTSDGSMPARAKNERPAESP